MTDETGKQMDLIDVSPENAGPIIEKAREYKEVVSERVGLTAKEVKLKAELLQLVSDADLQRLEDGKIRFEYDGVTITVTPRDELIQVKEES